MKKATTTFSSLGIIVIFFLPNRKMKMKMKMKTISVVFFFGGVATKKATIDCCRHLLSSSLYLKET
jgi:hypothetical protein